LFLNFNRKGCIPATIAIIDGECCVGLDANQLERIANTEVTKVKKASKRDIAYVCSKKMTAATTVASTMAIAHITGIRVFCTGGIGGVHQGAEETFDISGESLVIFKLTLILSITSI
jgi:pseudouridine-5'-phosphate glycosidase